MVIAARDAHSMAGDSPHKALLLELMPIGIAGVYLVVDFTAWQAIRDASFAGLFVLALNVAFSPLLGIAGFGWMGRGHKLIGGLVCLGRILGAPVILLMAVAPVDAANHASRAYEAAFFVLLALWFTMPVISACVLALASRSTQNPAETPLTP